MNEPSQTPVGPVSTPAPAASSGVPPPSQSTPVIATRQRMHWAYGVVLLVALLLSLAAGYLAWNTKQRLRSLESELVKRQSASASESAEARVLARQAETAARESSARVALVEARVAESTLQRSQLDEMMQSVARSRDENVLADLDASLRVAQQQAAITNSAQPLVLMLKQAGERLARQDQPRLERVRQAVMQDLERTRNAGGADIGVLAQRIDEVVRQIDDLPLLAMPERRDGELTAYPSPKNDKAAPEAGRDAASEAFVPALPSDHESAAGQGNVLGHWADRLHGWWQRASRAVWQEVRGLVRVTPITQPDAVLLTPEQGLFLRENLKLRLLNARLALLSRQYEVAQSDLLRARADLQRYFDRSARRVQAASAALNEVAAQSRQISVPTPEATIAALAAAAAPTGR